MRRARRLLHSVIPGLLFLVLFTMPARAFDEFAYDLRLIRALAEAKLENLAFLQVERMRKLYPEKEDVILLHKALIYYVQGKRSAGDEIVNAIPKGSPLYAESRLIKAQEAFRRGDFDTAGSAFSDYFSTNPRPRSQAPGDVEAFLETVFSYAQSMVEKGDAAGAAGAVDKASVIEGELALGEGQISYQKGRLALAAFDKAIDLGKKPDPNLLRGHIKKLEELQFKQIDYLVMINSLVEVSHGHIILGDMDASGLDGLKGQEKAKRLKSAESHYNKALQTLQSLSELLAAVKDQVQPKDSPLAGAYLQYGRARKGLARVELSRGKKELAIRLLNSAAKYFQRVKDDFGQSPYGIPALVEFGKLVELIKKIDPGFAILSGIDPESPLSRGGGAGAEGSALAGIKRADDLFRAKDYEKAIPLYQKALQDARVSSRYAPDTGLKLVVCYGRTDRMLEAQAIASYLADIFPDHANTADALLQLGAIPFKEAQEAEGERKDELLEEAMTAWDQFAELAPGHPKAADIAFVVAENEYRKASSVARRSQDEPDRGKREELKQEAREVYRQAIPKYERVIAEFGGTAKGARALYKLGWIYHSLDEPGPAAENFLAYSARETNPAYAEDRLEAKFRAGEQLMFSDTPAEAVPVLEELIKWTSAGNTKGFDADSEKAAKIREDSTSYIAWSYDLAAEAVRPKISERRDAIALQEDLVAESKTGLKRLDTETEELETWRQATVQGVDEIIDEFSKSLPRPEQRALNEFLPEEEVSQWSEAEREAELPLRKAQAADLAEDYRNQAIQTMEGQRAVLEEQKNQAFQQLQLAQNQLEETETSIRTMEEQLAELEEEAEYKQKEYGELADDHEQAVEEFGAASAAISQLKSEYEANREKLIAGSAEEQAAAKGEISRIRSLVPGARTKLARARRRVDQLEAADQVLARRIAERAAEAAADKVRTIRERLENAQRSKVLLGLEIGLREAELKAVNRAISQAQQFIALMRIPEDERYTDERLQNWQDGAKELRDLFEQFKQAVGARVEKAKNFLSDDRSELERMARVATDRISEIEKEIEPLQAQFEALKRKAQLAFTKFLEDYPKSRHVPDNMARLGTIFIEFDEYGKAEKYLDDLAKNYPGHKAVRQAMFNLGKVQFETGKVSEAAAAFKKVLATASEQAAGNLNYIVKATLDTEHADLAVQASRELLARSEDVRHEDYDKLSGRSRENLLFRAGRAAMTAGEYKAAAGYFDALLKENEKTARFFEANILKGRSCRLMKPPNLAEARRALDQVRRFAQDEAVINEALVELAEVYLTDERRQGVNRALTQLGQIVIVADGRIEVMGDDTDPESRPFVDRAFYLAARCYALLGDRKSAELVVEEYRKRFPDGRYRREIADLPEAKY